MNATQSKRYYEQHPDKLAVLVQSQLKDGWTADTIREYFRALGYDYFFECEVLTPTIFPKGTRVVVVEGDLGDSDKIAKTFDVLTKDFPQQHLVCLSTRASAHQMMVKHGWEEVV